MGTMRVVHRVAALVLSIAGIPDASWRRIAQEEAVSRRELASMFVGAEVGVVPISTGAISGALHHKPLPTEPTTSSSSVGWRRHVSSTAAAAGSSLDRV
ncbi:hypothetical protein RRF57_002766 [Xylaria bambusicola]|uniref:Uncharacterized protein n=1 Tax=Xylaria bambusicola TaxID=326684 RepID=A0AAN7Z730_9PEZI